MRTQLLERFARGTAFQGLGLGLSLVPGIAEAHGGAVSLGATPGGATTVELNLSLCAARPRGSKPQPVAAPGAGFIEPRAAARGGGGVARLQPGSNQRVDLGAVSA